MEFEFSLAPSQRPAPGVRFHLSASWRTPVRVDDVMRESSKYPRRTCWLGLFLDVLPSIRTRPYTGPHFRLRATSFVRALTHACELPRQGPRLHAQMGQDQTLRYEVLSYILCGMTYRVRSQICSQIVMRNSEHGVDPTSVGVARSPTVRAKSQRGCQLSRRVPYGTDRRYGFI